MHALSHEGLLHPGRKPSTQTEKFCATTVKPKVELSNKNPTETATHFLTKVNPVFADSADVFEANVSELSSLMLIM